jgi:hypothetical protein
MKLSRISFLLLLFFIFLSEEAHADIVFPAIAYQFMVSFIVPSYYSVLLAVLVLLVEAFFMKKFLSRTGAESLGLSFLINLFSSILGFFIVTFLEPFTREIVMGIYGYSNMRMGIYFGMLPGYVITVLVEWLFLLGWVKWVYRVKYEAKDLIKLSLIMNFFSYVILLGGVFFAAMITQGQNFQ